MERFQKHDTSSRLSLRRYPKDCPPLRTRWFYAVDTPKSKPHLGDQIKENTKPLPPPKKFVPFSVKDSQAIETAFQQLAEEEDTSSASESRGEPPQSRDSVKVPVNEDYLFDVDIERRELSPAYWLGPVYEVRRGTWFFQEGSTLKPCDENLATQLEEGYLKIRPWQFQERQRPKSRPTSTFDEAGKTHNTPDSIPGTPRPAAADLSRNPTEPAARERSLTNVNEPQNYRLFGAYMNSTVTYQDSSTAWLMYDDFVSRMSSTVYQRFGGVPGTKVIRGFTELKRPKETADVKDVDTKPSRQESTDKATSRASHREHLGLSANSYPEQLADIVAHGDELSSDGTIQGSHGSTLQRHMSSLAGRTEDDAELEEEARKREQQEMEDSRDADDEERDREIDHLVLVTHGIGQRLGLRLESINFVHDVNVLRKTLKSVYAASPDLQTLNSSFPDGKRNCRVQVLPVCWRHLLDFPKRGLRENRKELDLADGDELSAEDEKYPSLADITLEGVPAVRNLISDLAMDVLLYQSAYREHIATIVQQECNRIYKLFKERNPKFKGSSDDPPSDKQRSSANVPGSSGLSRRPTAFPLDFECEEFFCLGSPIALFQMLKGKTVAGRNTATSLEKGPIGLSGDRKSYNISSASTERHGSIPGDGSLSNVSPTVSSPKCEQLYNIFHPSDPVSYRVEPLISSAMAALKPQPLPSVKKSIWSASGQSLSNISSRVGQSVGSLWTNFTSGVASTLLNRSLGLSADGTHSQPAPNSGVTQSQQHAAESQEGIPGMPSPLDGDLGDRGEKPQTLIEPELETLYEGFRKTRDEKSKTSDFLENEERARKLKIEEAKVRSLNSNGRVDYSVQE
ncbi:DDHD domain-containing protein [Paecilomyces variotii No. 5]|uniref:DDHD domain-containing protein n=1 Tax=Byssochlamys spectabilis (strain No. 5 / NBRC 109023) TaxID=1356009 RepID=V5FK97_BYSSN|nr:DDHD domain-containing protein [Paecilomyces variotii No. 5]